ncbi:hypothetical protein GOP47_0011130 [Adiantum capillus-veneris]|uniref:Xylanase inhibitor C-terminal domain-containing protein n=1 Tax=Adiantum capillus-veneris TaxID=13818 RepID=A0A9D4ZGF5_ADICA|nr:hypothetical protein GOP47_0011130 [Adiantum capillus-veneris]
MTVYIDTPFGLYTGLDLSHFVFDLCAAVQEDFLSEAQQNGLKVDPQREGLRPCFSGLGLHGPNATNTPSVTLHLDGGDSLTLPPGKVLLPSERSPDIYCLAFDGPYHRAPAKNTSWHCRTLFLPCLH